MRRASSHREKERALVSYDAPAQLLPNSKMNALECDAIAHLQPALCCKDNTFLGAARSLAVHIDIAREIETEFNRRCDVRLHNDYSH
jgi:hypothetical protein